MQDETRSNPTPPADCPHGDALENPAPRGRFRIDRRLFVGAVLLLAVIAFGGMPNEVWVIAESAGAPDLNRGAGISSGDVALPAGAEAEFQLGRRIRLRVRGPAQLYLPAGPGRWFGGGRTLRIEEGRMLGTTGRSPLDFDLEIEAGGTRIGLVGGAFLIDRRGEVTGLALQEGNMAVMDEGGLNAEALIGQFVTIADDAAVEREFRKISDGERREFADLIAKGLPSLTPTQD